MRESLTQRLLCPTCADDVHVAAVESSFDLAGETHVVTGLLECSNRHRFPVVDEVPRMVPEHLLSDEELEARRKTPGRTSRHLTPEVISPDDAADAIRAAIARQYKLRPDTPAASRRRAQHHAN